MFVRSVLDKHGDGVAFVIEAPWRKEVGRVTTTLGAFFTENGDFSEGDLAAFVGGTLAPAVTSAAGKKGD